MTKFFQVFNLFWPSYKANQYTDSGAKYGAVSLGALAALLAVRYGLPVQAALEFVTAGIAAGANIGGVLRHCYDLWRAKRVAQATERVKEFTTVHNANIASTLAPSEPPLDDLPPAPDAVFTCWTSKSGFVYKPLHGKSTFADIASFSPSTITYGTRVWDCERSEWI